MYVIKTARPLQHQQETFGLIASSKGTWQPAILIILYIDSLVHNKDIIDSLVHNKDITEWKNSNSSKTSQEQPIDQTDKRQAWPLDDIDTLQGDHHQG